MFDIGETGEKAVFAVALECEQPDESDEDNFKEKSGWQATNKEIFFFSQLEEDGKFPFPMSHHFCRVGWKLQELKKKKHGRNFSASVTC